jgi:hypothetical protein
MNIEEKPSMLLAGDGYRLSISPEALERKEELLCHAQSVETVTTNDESADAQWVARKLAGIRIEVEKTRKEIKEPINRIGKLIDQAAAGFLAEIIAEETRIKNLVGAHATEVARLKAEKEEAERVAFAAARAAREAAETGGVAAVIAERKALAAKLAASNEVAATQVAEGVRFAWDFEVVDLYLLAKTHPDLVRIEPRRADILHELKEAEDGGAAMNPDTWAKEMGIRPFKKPVVSSR